MYETIRLEQHGNVALICLNRPKHLKALSTQMAREVIEAVEDIERNPDVGAIVVTGSEQAFAAGADISEMCEMDAAERDFAEALVRRE